MKLANEVKFQTLEGVQSLLCLVLKVGSEKVQLRKMVQNGDGLRNDRKEKCYEGR